MSQLSATTEKLWGKKSGIERGLKNQQKMITKSLERQKRENENQIWNQQIVIIKYLVWSKLQGNYNILNNSNSNNRSNRENDSNAYG